MGKRKRWLLRTLGILTILGVLTYIICAIVAISWRNVPVTAATTRIVTPLSTDGFPDYLAAINRDLSTGVTAENNSAPEILAIFGLRKNPLEWWKAQMSLLHDDVHLAPFVDFHDWYTAHSATQRTDDEDDDDDGEEDKLVRATLAGPWSRSQYPLVAGYLDANKSQIDAIEVLTRREYLLLPLITDDGATTTVGRPALLNVHYTAGIFREAEWAMRQRALLRLREGDALGFQDDTVSAIRLSLLTLQPKSLLEYLAGSGNFRAGMMTIQAAEASGLLTDDLARKVQAFLAAFPELKPPVAALDQSERYIILDSLAAMVDQVNGGGSPKAGASSSGTAIGIPLLPIHFENAFTTANRLFDRYADAMKRATYTERQMQLEAVDKDVVDLYPGGIAYGLMHYDRIMLRAIMVPEGLTLNRCFTECIAQQRLTQTALALHLFRSAHGSYPSSLEQAGISAALRTDPFSAAPMVYHGSPDSYLLYSIGPDLQDDGGKEKSRLYQKTGFDLAIRVPKQAASTHPD